jgi:hypothetical protein
VTAKAKGKTVVALTAAVVDWFIAMNRKEKAAVEGKPPRIPPITGPFFSAIIVVAVTQRLPTTKAKIRRASRSVSSIIGLQNLILLIFRL